MSSLIVGLVKPVKKTLSLKHVNQPSYIKSIVNEVYGIPGDRGMVDWDLFYDITTVLNKIDIVFQMRTQSAVLVIDGDPNPDFTQSEGVRFVRLRKYTGWHLKLIELEDEE